ncbi:class I adenylate-forming enzyme family protein [Phenylobacterium sp.]|uniref:class I adenylate-forming enzyme family protein n=1 Tax=Phenylobacterium sp. TaxID=1871053 RepID=UPI0035B0C984
MPADTAAWPAVTIAEAHARLTAPGQRYEMEEKVIRGIPTRTWKNAPATLREVFLNGRAFGPREFMVHEDERATFDAFARATLTLARQLQADGVGKGDRVAVIMRNLPEFPVAFFAAALVGAIVTPLNAWWTGAELEYGLTDSGTKVVLMDAERMERLGDHLANCPDLVRAYVSRLPAGAKPPAIVRQLEDVIGPVNAWTNLPDAPIPDVALEPEDDATIFYTSGTTGKPKGALGTHRNIVSNIMASGIAAARNFLRRGEEPPEVDPLTAPQRVTLLVVPLFHATGCHATLSPAVNAGGKLVFMRKWEPEEGMRLIEREKVAATGGVPTIAWQLIEHPARERFDLSSLNQVTYGGAPSAPELVRKIVETFPGSLPGNGWGMTETSATFASHLGKDYEVRPESCGPAAPTGEMKILSLDGATELAVGEVGELWVKGPNVVKGYWNKPEATAETFKEGWLRTGDLARVDEEGFCFIIDRAKDMLIRGGENIYCVEVENVLYDHPDVMDAALVGVPHKTLGEEPAAVVHLKSGGSATEAELRDWVRQRLAAFKVPVKVAFWPETLPRNANGKILKTELKKVFEEQE